MICKKEDCISNPPSSQRGSRMNSWRVLSMHCPLAFYSSSYNTNFLIIQNKKWKTYYNSHDPAFFCTFHGSYNLLESKLGKAVYYNDVDDYRRFGSPSSWSPIWSKPLYSPKYSSQRSGAFSPNNISQLSLSPYDFFRSSCRVTKASLERRRKKSSKVTIISCRAACVNSQRT